MFGINPEKLFVIHISQVVNRSSVHPPWLVQRFCTAQLVGEDGGDAVMGCWDAVQDAGHRAKLWQCWCWDPAVTYKEEECSQCFSRQNHMASDRRIVVAFTE